MNKEGYDKNFSTAVTVTAATTGLLIPPSNSDLGDTVTACQQLDRWQSYFAITSQYKDSHDLPPCPANSYVYRTPLHKEPEQVTMENVSGEAPTVRVPPRFSVECLTPGFSAEPLGIVSQSRSVSKAAIP